MMRWLVHRLVVAFITPEREMRWMVDLGLVGISDEGKLVWRHIW